MAGRAGGEVPLVKAWGNNGSPLWSPDGTKFAFVSNRVDHSLIGIYDVADKERFERVPVDPYIAELRRWQKTLDQPENVEPDGYGHQWGRVQLSEVRKYAAMWRDRERLPA